MRLLLGALIAQKTLGTLHTHSCEEAVDFAKRAISEAHTTWQSSLEGLFPPGSFPGDEEIRRAVFRVDEGWFRDFDNAVGDSQCRFVCSREELEKVEPELISDGQSELNDLHAALDKTVKRLRTEWCIASIDRDGVDRASCNRAFAEMYKLNYDDIVERATSV